MGVKAGWQVGFFQVFEHLVGSICDLGSFQELGVLFVSGKTLLPSAWLRSCKTGSKNRLRILRASKAEIV